MDSNLNVLTRLPLGCWSDLLDLHLEGREVQGVDELVVLEHSQRFWLRGRVRPVR